MAGQTWSTYQSVEARCKTVNGIRTWEDSLHVGKEACSSWRVSAGSSKIDKSSQKKIQDANGAESESIVVGGTFSLYVTTCCEATTRGFGGAFPGNGGRVLDSRMKMCSTFATKSHVLFVEMA
jgi:hypothetical protein